MSPEEQSRFDQAGAFIGDTLPSIWKRMYDNCIREGFTKDEAMLLLRTYIHGTAGGRLER